MLETTVTPNFQIQIPSEVLRELKVNPGQHFWISNNSGIIQLIPKKDINDLFGTLKGIDSNIEREDEDRI